MCERHEQKPLDYFCVEHEDLLCQQCATEEHTQSPCESMALVDASKHIQVKLDVGVAELKRLKGASQSILEGRRQDDTLETIEEAEALLDNFVEEMKAKFSQARAALRPFSELSREERWKLKAVAAKKPPVTKGSNQKEKDNYEAHELVNRLKDMRVQTKNAKEVLNTLPNYVEVSINPLFINTLKFDGKPILVSRKGHIEDSDDEEMDDGRSSHTTAQETVYLVEKSYFSLEHCTDIVMFDEYIIASVGDSLQKRDRKRMSFRQAITLEGSGKLCKIGETSEVSVLQKNGYITLILTHPDLVVLYKLLVDSNYIDISYLESSISGGRNCPEQSPVFAVCYSRQDAYLNDFVDLIYPKSTRHPGRLPHYNVESRTIAESQFGRSRSRFRGLSSVCTFQGRSIVVGALKGVTCISKTGVLIWTIDIYKPITQVMAFRTLIFVGIKGERKIMTIGKQGHVIEENVLPPIDIYPSKMSVHGDIMMVKHADKFKWIIFKKMYETVEDSVY